ncbi:MAG: ribonuclease PH [Myxococcales bacterium]
MRADGRDELALRPVTITPGTLLHPAGSATVTFGRTTVLCAVSVEERVPPFLMGKGTGWLTAEYSLLPGSTTTRAARERGGKLPSGRTLEIQRLIGRSLRMALDMRALGARTLTIDCDVVQADGGTRTAAVTGAWVALAQALATLQSRGTLAKSPLVGQVAAVSVGVVKDRVLLDLDYAEDSSAEVDMNVVMTATGELIEVQGTAESRPFGRGAMNGMLDAAEAGIRQLLALQSAAISGFAHAKIPG